MGLIGGSSVNGLVKFDPDGYVRMERPIKRIAQNARSPVHTITI